LTASGLHLTVANGRAPLDTLEAVNEALAPIGMRIWPLTLEELPPPIPDLLAAESLTESEVQAVKRHFLLPRDRLVALIEAAGRRPHVAAGGTLETKAVTFGQDYPQLHMAIPGRDYARFDRYHVNRAADGTAVDEVFQFLAGAGLRFFFRPPDGDEIVLTLDCPSPAHGWYGTHDGGVPHIGSVSAARPGSKVLVQVIGPEVWETEYL